MRYFESFLKITWYDSDEEDCAIESNGMTEATIRFPKNQKKYIKRLTSTSYDYPAGDKRAVGNKMTLVAKRFDLKSLQQSHKKSAGSYL